MTPWGLRYRLRGQRLPEAERIKRWWRVHNLYAHPLLVLWPRAGAWLHDWTAKQMGAP